MEQWLYRIQDRFAAIGYFYVAVFRYVIAVLLVGAYVSLRSEWHWPDQRSLLIGFLGHFLWLIAVLKALEFGIKRGVSGADRGDAAGFDRPDCAVSVG